MLGMPAVGRKLRPEIFPIINLTRIATELMQVLMAHDCCSLMIRA